jgi:hypothetical protein
VLDQDGRLPALVQARNPTRYGRAAGPRNAGLRNVQHAVGGNGKAARLVQARSGQQGLYPLQAGDGPAAGDEHRE